MQTALAEWHTLAAQAFTFAREAKIAELAADQSDTQHRAALRAALTAGHDVGTVEPSNGKELREQAAEHRRNYDAASIARTRLGFDLAPLLEAEAPSLAPAVNARISTHAAKIRTQLGKVRSEYGAWGRVFALRRWLSNTAINGGNLPNFDAQHGLPKAVSDALDVLTSHLDALERLESDEAEVTVPRRERLTPRQESGPSKAGAVPTPPRGHGATLPPPLRSYREVLRLTFCTGLGIWYFLGATNGHDHHHRRHRREAMQALRPKGLSRPHQHLAGCASTGCASWSPRCGSERLCPNGRVHPLPGPASVSRS
jgi:hypothetical protein